MIAALSEIASIFAGIAAIAGLITLVYQAWFCPRAKARRKALQEGKQAVDDDDMSGITQFFDRIRR